MRARATVHAPRGTSNWVMARAGPMRTLFDCAGFGSGAHLRLPSRVSGHAVDLLYRLVSLQRFQRRERRSRRRLRLQLRLWLRFRRQLRPRSILLRLRRGWRGRLRCVDHGHLSRRRWLLLVVVHDAAAAPHSVFSSARLLFSGAQGCLLMCGVRGRTAGHVRRESSNSTGKF